MSTPKVTLTGDGLGRVDHDSVSWTLYAIGECHMAMGRASRAKPFLTEARSEARRGGLGGRVSADTIKAMDEAWARCLLMLGAPRSVSNP